MVAQRRSGRGAVAATKSKGANLKRKATPVEKKAPSKKIKISPSKKKPTAPSKKQATRPIRKVSAAVSRNPKKSRSAKPKTASKKISPSKNDVSKKLTALKASIEKTARKAGSSTLAKTKTKTKTGGTSSTQKKRDSMEIDLMKTPIHLLRPLCRMLGISPDGNKGDIIYRLKNELSANRKETLNDTIRRASGDLAAIKEMSLINTNLHENFLAAGLTRIPDAASTAYEVAEWHDYDLSTRSWKSPCTLVRIKVDAKPFQRGAMRNAYKAYTLEHPDKVLVVKDYIDTEIKPNVYFKDVQMQVACSYYAKALMKRIEKCKADPTVSAQRKNILSKCHPLSFNDTFLIQMVGTDKIYTGEYFMPGRYAKFNNNFGYVAQRSDFMNEYAQAFSHFSHEESRGQLLICDIQGTNEMLTDPQVHTADPDSGFGMGNLSMEGIEKFLETHHCNSVCKAIGLTAYVKDSGKNKRKVVFKKSVNNLKSKPKKAYRKTGIKPPAKIAAKKKIAVKKVKKTTSPKKAPKKTAKKAAPIKKAGPQKNKRK